MLMKPSDLSLLLTPISTEYPHGEYLKSNSSLYRPLRNLFNISQTSLRKLISNPQQEEIESIGKENSDNWNKLSVELISTFKHKARDISLIGWYICSQIVLDPTFKSLQLSLSWLETLLSEQWAILQPNVEHSDFQDHHECEQIKHKELSLFLGDTKESCLFYTPFMLTPLIGRINFYQYTQAEHKGEKDSLKQQVRVDILNEQTIIIDKQEALSNCLKSLNVLQEKTYASTEVQHRCSFSFFIKIIESYLIALNNLSSGIIKLPVNNEINSIKENVEERSENFINTLLPINSIEQYFNDNSKITSRESAFLQLRELSNYLRATEPHSPVSFLIEKAIRWGQLSLKELWQEILNDKSENQIERIFNITGVNEESLISLPKAIGLNKISSDINNELQLKEDQEVLLETSLSNIGPLGNIEKKENQPAENKTALSW
nr:type VI secretion system ImpA family N-terminal domain-containing protein [uncultured Moellerella sp.]